MTVFAKRDYTLELVTPAFLGGADQSAEWRTPAIKALIRQWWRVAYVAKHGVNVKAMREAEGRLFGTVNGEASKALVSIRFNGLPKSTIENVTNKISPTDQSQALPYLGFGPFEKPSSPSQRNALAAKSSTHLSIIIKSDSQEQNQQFVSDIEVVLALIARFGTLGSRSHNGWGSLKVTGALANIDLEAYTRPFEQCLQNDWITGIGKDSSGLMIWQTNSSKDWKVVMQDLKFVRKELQNRSAKTQGKRPLINGPVAGNQERWPNQFSFKILPQANDYVGQIALLPHQWPTTKSQLPKLLKDIVDGIDSQNRLYKRINK